MGQGLRLEDVRALYALRAEDAARRLGVSPRSFRRRCRALGIRRWPHRAVVSKRARAKLVCEVAPPGRAGSEVAGCGAGAGPRSRPCGSCKEPGDPATGLHPSSPDSLPPPRASREPRPGVWGPPSVPCEVIVKEAVPAVVCSLEVLRMQQLVLGMATHFAAWQTAQALCSLTMKALPPAPIPLAPAGPAGPLTGAAIALRGQCVGDAEGREAEQGGGSEADSESSSTA